MTQVGVSDVTSLIGAANGAREPGLGGGPSGDGSAPLLRIVKKAIYGFGGALKMDPWDLAVDNGCSDACGCEGKATGFVAAPCSVFLRLLAGYPRRKRLFMIRHGESEWNKAQASLDPLSMYAQVDHPLSVRRRAHPSGWTLVELGCASAQRV